MKALSFEHIKYAGSCVCSLNILQINLNVSIVDGPQSNSNRILALVEYNNSFALFVLVSSRTQPVSFSDLSIETVVPVDQSFACGKLLPSMFTVGKTNLLSCRNRASCRSESCYTDNQVQTEPI